MTSPSPSPSPDSPVNPTNASPVTNEDDELVIDLTTQELPAVERQALLVGSGGIGYTTETFAAVDAAGVRDSDTPVESEAPTRGPLGRDASERSALDLPLGAEDGEAGFQAPPVDPRMIARRDGVATQRRRSKRRRIAMIVGTPLAVVALFVALHSPLIDVDRITIVGSDSLDLAEVERVTGLALGDSMITTRLGEVEAALGADPRFGRVAVERAWPNEVRIRVTDRPLVAAVTNTERSFIVAKGGVVVREAHETDYIRRVLVHDDLDVEVGGALPPAIGAAVDIVASLPFAVTAQIAEIEFSEAGELIFTLTNDATVLFGTVDKAPAKVSSLTTMLTSNVDRTGVCQIDVRVPRAPTMRRSPNCHPPVRPRDAVPPAESPTESAPVEPAVVDPVAEEPAVVDSAPQPAAVDPRSEGIVAPPTPAATATGNNREPGADGGA